MRINNNMQAMNTNRQLGNVQSNQAKSMEKLSSGYRINRAGDDAAGLAISEKMRGQISGLDQASRNAEDGISMIQTAEGALNETQNILQRMRELSVQSATDTNTDDDRVEIQKEIDQLTSEIDRISDDTEFNTKKLLNGTAGVQGISSASTNASFVSGTADTVAGTYEVTVNTEATQESYTNNGTVADLNTATDIDSVELSINGESVDFTDITAGAATANEILTAIGEIEGVTASIDGTSGALTITSDEYGSGTLSITGTDLTKLFGDAGVETAGENAVVSVTDGPQSIEGEGRNVTFESGDVEGLTITAAGAGSSSANITVTSGAQTLQIGANEDQTLKVAFNDMGADNLGTVGGSKVSSVDLSTQSGASDAITTINDALTQVSSERSKFGAVQNRLEYTISNLDTSAENLQSAESRIRDVDMATEMMEFTKNNILSSAATSMLSQANQAPQSVLQLLQ